MTDTEQKCFCGECGNELMERPGISLEERKPCVKCGSLERTFKIFIQETVTAKEMIGLKKKQSGFKKPRSEILSGDDLHKKTGKWVKKERIIDRENDKYKESITDPDTGEIIHYSEEALSDHFGHGSAKDNS